MVRGDNGTLLCATNTRHTLFQKARAISQELQETNATLQNKTAFELTLPQSLREDELADAIFCFFLLSFNFSPAKTTSLASFRHSGQYLKSPVNEN